jgi:hypothetical protein
VGRRRRQAALRYSAVVLAVAAAVPIASGIAAAMEASAVPSKLVGAWSRNATLANWNKYGQGGFPVGVWTMVVKKSGGVDLYTPGGYKPGCIAKKTCFPDFLTAIAVTGTHLTVAAVPVCPTKGTYAWKVSGRSLALKAIADKQCGPREALFNGVWKRT